MHKANFWTYPPDISQTLHEGRALVIRTQAHVARAYRCLEESDRRCREYLAARAAAAGRCIKSLAEWSNGRTQGF